MAVCHAGAGSNCLAKMCLSGGIKGDARRIQRQEVPCGSSFRGGGKRGHGNYRKTALFSGNIAHYSHCAYTAVQSANLQSSLEWADEGTQDSPLEQCNAVSHAGLGEAAQCDLSRFCPVGGALWG